MPALQVRDFPDDLYEELKECAARNHRSIAQQTIACVEGELKRDKLADGEGRIVELAPGNVREALLRARPVDPFAWLNAFEAESDETQAARSEKRKKWKRDLHEMGKHWKKTLPTSEEIAAMIREDRENRSARIVENVEGYLARKGAQA